jgi:hypothetical protein
MLWQQSSVGPTVQSQSASGRCLPYRSTAGRSSRLGGTLRAPAYSIHTHTHTHTFLSSENGHMVDMFGKGRKEEGSCEAAAAHQLASGLGKNLGTSSKALKRWWLKSAVSLLSLANSLKPTRTGDRKWLSCLILGACCIVPFTIIYCVKAPPPRRDTAPRGGGRRKGVGDAYWYSIV